MLLDYSLRFWRWYPKKWRKKLSEFGKICRRNRRSTQECLYICFISLWLVFLGFNFWSKLGFSLCKVLKLMIVIKSSSFFFKILKQIKVFWTSNGEQKRSRRNPPRSVYLPASKKPKRQFAGILSSAEYDSWTLARLRNIMQPAVLSKSENVVRNRAGEMRRSV